MPQPDSGTPLARLTLVRQPEQPATPLQAFDAADEYLLHHLQEQGGLAGHERLLLLNDSFGALACALAGQARITSSGDSHLGYLALQKNLARNACPTDNLCFVPASQPLQGPFDRVLIRIPKTLALLEEQLIRLQGQLAPGARVVAAAMLKHLPRSAGGLLERHIGPVQASLAVKKARLLQATPAPRPGQVSPYPSLYRLEQPPITLSNQASLFCREGLDIGTRTLLPHLQARPERHRVADLGCGNGILGIVHALHNPEAQLILVDESYMAVQSARDNWQALLGARPVQIIAADGLAGQPPGSLDLVLCNPPFHQQQVVGDFLASRMLRQAWQALACGGELLLVGNRHLGYHQRLRRLFGSVRQLDATPKFVVLLARKTAT